MSANIPIIQEVFTAGIFDLHNIPRHLSETRQLFAKEKMDYQITSTMKISAVRALKLILRLGNK